MNQESQGEYVVRARGLPWSATTEEVAEFLSGNIIVVREVRWLILTWTGIWTQATLVGGECSHHRATLAPLISREESQLLETWLKPVQFDESCGNPEWKHNTILDSIVTRIKNWVRTYFLMLLCISIYNILWLVNCVFSPPICWTLSLIS